MCSDFKLSNHYYYFYAVSTSLLIISLCAAKVTEEHVLDVSYPIIISGDGQDSFNMSKSYFGYTVSLAQGKKSGQGKSSQDPDGWILIGAPKANASSAMYSRRSNEPGVIWRCSLGRSSSTGDTCSMVNVDPSPGGGKRPNSPQVESYDGAWIGASMEVNHGRLLTCGMRWNRGMNQFYNGICYWFSDTNSTSRSSYRSNDLSKLVDETKYDQRLTPFFRQKRDQDRLFDFFNSANESHQGHEWQISQAGMSIHLFRDEGLGSSMPNLLIGAPGVREWSGAVALYTNSKLPRPDIERPNRNPTDTDATFSEFVIGNRGRIPDKDTYRRRNYWNEYFGYSVSSGKYLSKSQVLYAAGAPRAEHSGEVVLFDFPPYHPPSSTYKRQIRAMLEIPAPKHSFASYFGSVLHSVDLDGDGMEELIVGAPLHTFFSGLRKTSEQLEKERGALNEKEGKLGNFQESGDHGCVFVYKFKDSEEDATNRTEPIQNLFGSKSPLARFGSAISTLVFNQKDTRRQKEIYLVIGAPYEVLHPDDSTSGAVYLYLYNKQTGKFGAFSQRIIGSSISNFLNGFGSSLGIPEDIDDNDTPDLAIGSYKSGHAIVLRTRPKIRLESWIKFISFEGVEIQEIRRGVPQFYLKSCFSVAETLGLVSLKLNIWVKVQFSDPTIKFHEDLVRAIPENKANEIIYMREVDAHTVESCQNLTVLAVHKDGIGMDDSDTLTEIKHPLRFKQEVWYNETLNRPLSVLNYYAEDSPNSRLDRFRKAEDFNAFEKRKPSPQVSESDEDLFISLTDCRDPVCRPTIQMTWTFYNENNEQISYYKIGTSKEIKLEIVISNTGETAALPSFTLDWNVVDIKESPSGSRWLRRTCRDYSDTRMMTFGCPLGQYIRKARNTTIEIQFVMEDIFVKRSGQFPFEINGAISFADKHIEPFKSKGDIRVIVPPTMVSIMGARESDTMRSPLQYVTSTKDKLTDENNEVKTTLYSPVRQRFTIEVKGASVKSLTAQIKIPVTSENSNSGQLVFVKQLNPNANGVTCKPSGERFHFHMIDSVNNIDGSLTFMDHPERKIAPRNKEPIQRKRKDTSENNASNIFPTRNSEGVTEIAIDMEPLKPPKKVEKMVVPSDAFKLSCSDSEANCLEVTCTLENVKANTHVHIPFELYLVKDSIDNILTSSGKASLFIESTGLVYIFNAGTHHEDRDVSQTALVKISGKEVELWWYIVAGLGGICLLALIIGALYKCGFFKREKLQQLNHMKAEHHRKSMAAARASMMMQAGSSMDGLILEELTETEHKKEDKEPDQIQEDVK